jgi:hypothetical protein
VKQIQGTYYSTIMDETKWGGATEDIIAHMARHDTFRLLREKSGQVHKLLRNPAILSSPVAQM